MKILKYFLMIALFSLSSVMIQAINLKMINNYYHYYKCFASIMDRGMMWQLDTINNPTERLPKGNYSVATFIYRYEYDQNPIKLNEVSMDLANNGDLVVDASDYSVKFYLLAS